jgi:hypothetical protein
MLLIAIGFAVDGAIPLAAQTAAAPTTPPAAGAAAANAAAAPADSGESWLTGYIDLGYQWRTGVGGSFDTYRSVVDLGSGPKLFGADFTIFDPAKRLFDRIDVRAYDWGGQPYSTLHVDVRKSKVYDFHADYRNIAYFNNLASFADPLMTGGVTLDEQAEDIHQRMSSFQLELLPGHWLVPYLSFDRNSNSGTGVVDFVSDSNEYPVPDRIQNSANNYRGGVHFELPRVHVTLEMGGITYKDSQSDYVAPGSTNYGNTSVPILGQTLDLTSLLQAYGVSGNSIYTKGLLTANPVSWLDVYGQFLYSKPDTSVSFQQYNVGNFAVLDQALFYTAQQYLITGVANMPHTSGSFGVELRPYKRVRVIQSWLTDRMHDDGSNAVQQIFSTAALSQPSNAYLDSGLVTNYNQEETDVMVDLGSRITIHGGFRYVWGDANDVVLPAADLVSSDSAILRRKVGIGGVTFRPMQKLTFGADFEGASSDDAYFATSLRNYFKMHATARYQVLHALMASAVVTYLENQNPLSGIDYAFNAHQESLSLLWTPGDSKLFDLEGSYTRSTMYSNIGYYDPGTLTPEDSIYRDNSHIATALFGFNLPKLQGGVPRLSAGGSLFISSGSRPTSYYQPLVRFALPFTKHLSWNSEWRYYGYGENFYKFESFRTNLITTSLRFSR